MSKVTIQGIAFDVPEKYGEGHTLTANEADVLNQTYKENIRNNFASQVDKAKAEAETNGAEVNVEDLQRKLNDYVAEYSFGVRRGGGAVRVADPVEREARSIARKQVVEALKKKDISLKTVPADKMNAFIDQALAQHGDVIREKARTVVAAQQAAASEFEVTL